MDGYEVMPMRAAAKTGEIFCSVTGCRDVIGAEHFPLMRDGAILSNAGHFNVEIDMDALNAMAVRKYTARHNITAYVMPDGRELFVLGEGRLVNLACGDGHPAEIMDMSFAIQALSAEYLAKHAGELDREPMRVPREIDDAVARRKLRSLGVEIDALSPRAEGLPRNLTHRGARAPKEGGERDWKSVITSSAASACCSCSTAAS